MNRGVLVTGHATFMSEGQSTMNAAANGLAPRAHG